MIKRALPLLIGLSICGVAFGQAMPAGTSPANRTSSTTMAATEMPQPSSPALSESAVKAAIAGAGYKEVKGLKFEKGVWRTKARGGNAQWVEIRVGPVTGKVYVSDAPSRLNADEVKAKLAAAGYQNVHDVEYKHGLWNVDASTAKGRKVNLLVDPDDASVVAMTDA